jgi:hypothetical protein
MDLPTENNLINSETDVHILWFDKYLIMMK